jgi:hypothetical protein
MRFIVDWIVLRHCAPAFFNCQSRRRPEFRFNHRRLAALFSRRQKKSRMKTRTRIIGIVIVLLFVRGCYIVFNSGGNGGGAISPKKNLLAVGESFEGKRFWGGQYTYYEFSIKTTNDDVICHYKLENPPLPLADWREDGDKLIQWALDSSSVTYNFNGGHLTLSVKP